MQLKWPDLDKMSQKSLNIISSKDVFLLRYAIDYLLKKHAAKFSQTLIKKHFIDQAFSWTDCLIDIQQGGDLFYTSSLHIFYHFDSALSNEAKEALEAAAQYKACNTIIILSQTIHQRDKWIKAWEEDYYFLQWWPMQQQAFYQWLKQAQTLFNLALDHDVLKHIASESDNHVSLALNILKKLASMDPPYSESALTNLLQNEHPVNVFDLQRVLIEGQTKKVRDHFEMLWHQKKPLSLLNWLFKNEITRLLTLSKCTDLEGTLKKLGIHFTQKQYYSQHSRQWSEASLIKLLNLTEKIDILIIKNDRALVKEMMLNLIHALLKGENALRLIEQWH